MQKICIQCKIRRDIENFRQYPSRGTGKYKTKTGHSTICTTCDRVNNMAAFNERKCWPDGKIKEQLCTYYSSIAGKVPAVGRRLLGIKYYEAPPRSKSVFLDNVLAEVQEVQRPSDTSNGLTNEAELLYNRITNRMFDSSDEADAAYKEFKQRVPDAGRYNDESTWDEMIVEALDDWFLEE